MHKFVMIAVALVGCAKKDDCERAYDKLMPIVTKLAGDRKMPPEEQAKALEECRAGMAGSGKEGDKALIKCVLDADGDDAVKACMAAPMKDYQTKSKKTEAALQLDKLGKNAKIYYITNAAFPSGTSTTMPDKPCFAGPNGHCPVAPPEAWTKDPVWASLDFQIDDPNLFQYHYTSDGKTATVTAIGDLDCDGTSITYTLHLDSAGGNASMKLDEPPPNAD